MNNVYALWFDDADQAAVIRHAIKCFEGNPKAPA